MGISPFGINFPLLSADTMGQLWTPKAQRLSVGRDLCPISMTAFAAQDRKITVANGDDVRFTSNEIYGFAKIAAQNDLCAGDFRLIKTDELTYGNTPVPAASPEGEADILQQNLKAMGKRTSVHSDPDRSSFMSGNTLILTYSAMTEDGKTPTIIERYTIASDCRILWDENNRPKLLSGGEALTDGKLKATSAGEIIIRKSGVDVEAGEKSTVFNMSGEAGNFSGGSDVTYRGNYAGCEIAGGSGTTEYRGYFENAVISGLAGKNVFSGVFENTAIETGAFHDAFSGYFRGASILGGDGENTFGGMFLNGSTAQGGDGNDRFSGRFIDAGVNAGGGNNTFGNTLPLDLMKRVVAEDGHEYRGLEADFIDSAIVSGDGDDSFQSVVWGGTVNLGDGDNTASGVFSESAVTSGKGDDSLSALYSRETTFEAGDGDDAVNLATAFASSVRTGEGTTAILMGQNPDETSRENGRVYGGDTYLRGSLWQSAREERNNDEGKRYGELDVNAVDASVGENVVHVRDGNGTRSVWTGNKRPEENTAEEAEAEKTAPPAGESGVHLGQVLQKAEDEETLIAPPTRDEGVSGNTAVNRATRREQRKAVGRYARQSGDIPAATGGTGVSITTGAEEPINIRTYDSMRGGKPELTPVYRVTHRGIGFGQYRIDRGLI